MQLFLDAGLALSHFDEPQPTGGSVIDVARYRSAPWFLIMEWAKPAAPSVWNDGRPTRH